METTETNDSIITNFSVKIDNYFNIPHLLYIYVCIQFDNVIIFHQKYNHIYMYYKVSYTCTTKYHIHVLQSIRTSDQT